MPNITSGEYKNRNLLISKDFIRKHNIRPTANYTKQLVMNLIKNGNIIPKLLNLNEAMVVDICAGTGAIGFELLSNGAKHCHFIDNNNLALHCIKDTAKSLGLSAQISTTANITNLRKFEQVVDLIFIDPPYAEQERILQNFLSIASKSACIAEKTIIIAETYKDLSQELMSVGCKILDNRPAISKTFIATFTIK